MPESTPQESMTAEMAEELAFARDIDERYRRANPALLTLGQTADWRRWRLFLQRDAELSAALERVRGVENLLLGVELWHSKVAAEANIEISWRKGRWGEFCGLISAARAALNPPSATTGQETYVGHG